MNLEKLIGELISMIHNDLRITASYVEENSITDGKLKDWDYEKVNEAFVNLQIELTRVLIGHQYCSNKDCSCAPEKRVTSLLENNKKIYDLHLYGNQLEWLNEEFMNNHQRQA